MALLTALAMMAAAPVAPPDYRAGHLPGAIYIPPIQVRQLAAKRLPDPDAEIVLYCAHPG